MTSGGVSVGDAARRLGARPATAFYWVRVQQELDAAVAKAEEAADPAPNPRPSPAAASDAKGRRDLFASKLPRISVGILHAELEGKRCIPPTLTVGAESARPVGTTPQAWRC